MKRENNNQELAKITKIESVTVYDPEKLNRKLVTVKTVSDAMKIAHDYPSQFPSLAKIRANYGSKATERIIKLYMIELTELVNLKRPLTEKQIDTIAMEVVVRHYAMTIADVHVIFKKAINGEFGDFYESLDVPKVMKWFDLYFDERCEIGAQDSINSQFYDKGGNITSERMATHFNNLQKQMTKK